MSNMQKVIIHVNQKVTDITIRLEYKGYLISGINFFNIYNSKTQALIKADVKTIADAKDYIDRLKPLK